MNVESKKLSLFQKNTHNNSIKTSPYSIEKYQYTPTKFCDTSVRPAYCNPALSGTNKAQDWMVKADYDSETDKLVGLEFYSHDPDKINFLKNEDNCTTNQCELSDEFKEKLKNTDFKQSTILNMPFIKPEEYKPSGCCQQVVNIAEDVVDAGSVSINVDQNMKCDGDEHHSDDHHHTGGDDSGDDSGDSGDSDDDGKDPFDWFNKLSKTQKISIISGSVGGIAILTIVIIIIKHKAVAKSVV